MKNAIVNWNKKKSPSDNNSESGAIANNISTESLPSGRTAKFPYLTSLCPCLVACSSPNPKRTRQERSLILRRQFTSCVSSPLTQESRLRLRLLRARVPPLKTTSCNKNLPVVLVTVACVRSIVAPVPASLWPSESGSEHKFICDKCATEPL